MANGAVELGPWVGRIGESKPLAVSWRHETGADLSSSTVTFEVWDDTGTAVLTPTAATCTGTSKLRTEYFVVLGSPGTITTAGNYRGIMRLTYGTIIREVQIPMIVLARPS